MQRQSQAVARHQEQLERMQEKLLNMSVEEDKLKEEFKSLKNAPSSQCSSQPVSIAGTAPHVSECEDADMEDPFGPLASDDEGAGTGINFHENEDASRRARVDAPPAPPPTSSCAGRADLPPAPPSQLSSAPSVATVTKAIGDGQFSKQEAEKLRKRLENYLADVDNDANEWDVAALATKKMGGAVSKERAHAEDPNMMSSKTNQNEV